MLLNRGKLQHGDRRPSVGAEERECAASAAWPGSLAHGAWRGGRSEEGSHRGAAQVRPPEHCRRTRLTIAWHRAFEDSITSDTSDDPLVQWTKCGSAALRRVRSTCDAWHRFACRYYKWLQAEFPAGGPESKITQVLERATRELKRHERYRHDLRYVRLWIAYVRAAPLAATIAAHGWLANCLAHAG